MMNQSQVMNPVHVIMHHHQLPQVVPHHRSNGIWPQSQQSSIESMNRENYPVQNWIDRRETAGMKSGGRLLGHGGGYRPPNWNQNKNQNHRRFYPNKKLMKKKRFAAPRNTTSFLIRANRCGGIAELVSPYPVTPAILETPQLLPSREVLGDMVKEEWGVDGYGSMNGLIRLKEHEHDEVENENEEGNGSSSSDSDDHIEMEKKLDHDLRRFEMIYRKNYGGRRRDDKLVLENRVNDQDDHISELEKENMLLREKLNFIENEMNDLKKILQNHEGDDDHEEEHSLME
ncbi:uncharacterized protein LOC124936330 [Impatiens glandulifera]|uniref:uncharacterized protein LOC124936330 n=1 Tax=Impatiens glandulifera TaxID=253017 RepID=UPI001FB0E8A9|nr:uncharacterized protein LOC124936330 [Impatiens glandulifera]